MPRDHGCAGRDCDNAAYIELRNAAFRRGGQSTWVCAKCYRKLLDTVERR